MNASSKQRAYRHIRAKVLSGSIAPGSKLSTPRLAKEMGLSRTPVREAINLLASEGLVDQLPDAGAYVRKVSRRELWELFLMREALEIASVGRAIRRINARQLATLARHVDAFHDVARHVQRTGMKRLDEPSAVRCLETDMAFHFALLRASGNRQITKVVGDQQIISRIFRVRLDDEPIGLLNNLSWTLMDHHRILRAIERRDVKAARHFLRRHFARGRQKIRAVFAWEDRHRGDGTAEQRWPAEARSTIARMERDESEPS